MKTKKVGVKSKDEFFRETHDFIARLEKGAKPKKHVGIYFDSLETLRSILTPKRLEIIRAIKKKRPTSIYSLAKGLGRDIKNVTDDLGHLEKAGLVELRKSVGSRGVVPIADYDKIEFEIAV